MPELREVHVMAGNVRVSKNGSFHIGPHGAGVILSHKNDRTYILTALHTTYIQESCNENSYKLGVWIYENATPIDARVESRSIDGFDAAVISTKSFRSRTAKISKKGLRKGSRVFVFGSPLGSYRTILRRRVNRFSRFYNSELRRYNQRIVLDGPIKPGFSGGGMFYPTGELAGICIAMRVEEGNNGVCLPITHLRNLINPYII